MITAIFSFVALPLAFVAIGVIVVAMNSSRKRENRARYEAELRYWYEQYPNPQPGSAPPPPAPPSHSPWSTAGTVVAVMAAVGGLAVLAMAVTLFVVISSGSFKFGNK